MQSHLPEFDLLVPRPSAVLLEFVRGLGMNARLSKVSAGEGHHPSTHHARLRSLKIDRPEITIIYQAQIHRQSADGHGAGGGGSLLASLLPCDPSCDVPRYLQPPVSSCGEVGWARACGLDHTGHCTFLSPVRSLQSTSQNRAFPIVYFNKLCT